MNRGALLAGIIFAFFQIILSLQLEKISDQPIHNNIIVFIEHNYIALLGLIKNSLLSPILY